MLGYVRLCWNMLDYVRIFLLNDISFFELQNLSDNIINYHKQVIP